MDDIYHGYECGGEDCPVCHPPPPLATKAKTISGRSSEWIDCSDWQAVKIVSNSSVRLKYILPAD